MELPALSRPEQLWWLLPLLPLLWWLALPPRPRRVLVTAHRAQWLRALGALRRRPPRFRPVRLLLLLLGAVAVALAAAAPATRPRPGPERLLVLLDGSASMAAQRGGATAFARALETVRRELAALPAHVEVEVVQVNGGGVQRWSGPAARALASVRAPEGALPAPLPELGAAAAASGRTAVWTVTDGRGAVPDVGALSCTGAPAGNGALLAVAVRDGWPLPELEVQAELCWYGPGAAEGRLAIEGAVMETGERTVALPAGERVAVRLALRRTRAGGPLGLRLSVPGDALALDDGWAAVLPPLPAPRIAVLADGEPGSTFATRAAEALAAEVGGEVVAATAGEEAGLLLVEGGSAALEPGSAPFWTFGTLRPGEKPAVWADPLVVDWDRQDPLMAGLDWSELRIAHALDGALPEGQELLWGSGAGRERRPLAVLVEGARAASLHFAFRLQDSNLGLLPAFPQLLRRGFLRAHREAARIAVTTPPPAPEESDLRGPPPPADRPLPGFGAPARPLAPWCLLLALVLLAVRAGLR